MPIIQSWMCFFFNPKVSRVVDYWEEFNRPRHQSWRSSGRVLKDSVKIAEFQVKMVPITSPLLILQQPYSFSYSFLPVVLTLTDSSATKTGAISFLIKNVGNNWNNNHLIFRDKIYSMMYRKRTIYFQPRSAPRLVINSLIIPLAGTLGRIHLSFLIQKRLLISCRPYRFSHTRYTVCFFFKYWWF